MVRRKLKGDKRRQLGLWPLCPDVHGSGPWDGEMCFTSEGKRQKEVLVLTPGSGLWEGIPSQIALTQPGYICSITKVGTVRQREGWSLFPDLRASTWDGQWMELQWAYFGSFPRKGPMTRLQRLGWAMRPADWMETLVQTWVWGPWNLGESNLGRKELWFWESFSSPWSWLRIWQEKGIGPHSQKTCLFPVSSHTALRTHTWVPPGYHVGKRSGQRKFTTKDFPEKQNQ